MQYLNESHWSNNGSLKYINARLLAKINQKMNQELKKFLKTGEGEKMKRKNLAFWSFVGPSLLAFMIVVIIPLIFGMYYSFTDWNGINSKHLTYVEVLVIILNY